MPILLLVIGLGLTLYGLYRFFVGANTRQIYALFLSVTLLVLAIALFYLAVTGRLAAAAALLVAIVPIVAPALRHKKSDAPAPASSNAMSRAEALEILNLGDDADKAAINAAYKKLMMKVHPDQEGSEWMAAKLNQARDILIK